MLSSCLRLGACLAGVLVLMSPARADEAAAMKQLAKLGAPVTTFRSVKETAFTFTKGVDGHLKLLPEVKGLTCVGLADTDVTDAGLQSIGRLTTLRKFWIISASGANGTGVTDAGVKELRTLEKLEDLTLDRTKVTGTCFKELKNLKVLRKMNLRNSPVTDEGARYIAELPDVRVLDLTNTRITDEGLRTLGRMDHVDNLYLASTAVTDQGLKVFQNPAAFGGLRVLDLRQTRVTRAGVDRFKIVRPRVQLYLDR